MGLVDLLYIWIHLVHAGKYTSPMFLLGYCISPQQPAASELSSRLPEQETPSLSTAATAIGAISAITLDVLSKASCSQPVVHQILGSITLSILSRTAPSQLSETDSIMF